MGGLKMKLKIISLVILFVFLASFVPAYAQEETEDVDVEQVLEDTTLPEDEVGVTPDKAGYGLKIAIEKIRMALAFSKERKAKLALQLADKRLEEAKLMAALNNLEALQRSKDEHRKLVQKAKSEIETLSGEDEDDLETQVELESELEEQENKVGDLENIILIKTKGLSEEQRQKLLELVESFKTDTGEVKVKIAGKKQEIKIRLRAKGINETEIEDKLEANVERFANHQVDQSQKMFDLASRTIEKAKSSVNITVSQETLEVKAKAETKLNEAKSALTNKEYKKAVELAHESKRLSALTIASIRGLDKDLIEKRLENLKEFTEKRTELREKLEVKVRDRLKKIEDDDEDNNEEEDELEDNEGSSNNSSNTA